MDAAPVRTAKPTPAGRAPLIFAIAGLVVALVVGGAYLYRASTAAPPRSPEATVQEFLAGVFLAASAERVGPVVCASWDAADAIERTSNEVESGVSISWDQIRVAAIGGGRATLRARLGLRRPDDVRPSVYQQWRFSLVDEGGWRVCDASPFIV